MQVSILVLDIQHVDLLFIIASGENLGWALMMREYSSLKMITDKYFSYIANMNHQNESKLLEEDEKMDSIEKKFIIWS